MQTDDRIHHQLSTIVKPHQIQRWDCVTGSLQYQLSQAIAPTHTPTCVVYPQTQAELAEIVACAHHHGWKLLPCGHGSKLHWGGISQAIDVVISTSKLTQIIEHADGDLTLTVEAGLSFSELQNYLKPMKQWLPLDPHYAPLASMGGILATADAGALRQRYGGARDRVIGLSMVRNDGQLAKAGGRVVKNVAGYDLMKLLTGSWGSLGIISQVTLRLHPQQPASQTLYLTGPSSAIQTVATALFASSLTPTAAVVLSPWTAQCLGLNRRDGSGQGDDLTLVVQFQSISVSIEQQVKQLTTWSKQQAIEPFILEDEPEVVFWQQIHSHMEEALPHEAQRAQATSKVGVLPANVVSTLAHLHRQQPHLKGWINIGNGLGMIQCETDSTPDAQKSGASLEGLKKMRSHCESNGGFLTLLAAPQAWKQQLKPSELWGYSGNALPVMQRIKQEFDPDHQLSPGRFLV